MLREHKKAVSGTKDNPKTKSDRDADSREFIEALKNRINEREQDGDFNDNYAQSVEERSAISLAIKILTGVSSSDLGVKVATLQGAYADLLSIYDEGRSVQKEWEEQRKQERARVLKKALDEVNPKGKSVLKTERELLVRRVYQARQPRLLYKIFNGSTMGDLDSAFRVMSKKDRMLLMGVFLAICRECAAQNKHPDTMRDHWYTDS